MARKFPLLFSRAPVKGNFRSFIKLAKVTPEAQAVSDDQVLLTCQAHIEHRLSFHHLDLHQVINNQYISCELGTWYQGLQGHCLAAILVQNGVSVTSHHKLLLEGLDQSHVLYINVELEKGIKGQCKVGDVVSILVGLRFGIFQVIGNPWLFPHWNKFQYEALPVPAIDAQTLQAAIV